MALNKINNKINKINLNKINLNIVVGKKGFEAGHIISENDGGKIELSNLIAICNICNIDMKTKNMYEYQEEKYPLVLKLREYMKQFVNKKNKKNKMK